MVVLLLLLRCVSAPARHCTPPHFPLHHSFTHCSYPILTPHSNPRLHPERRDRACSRRAADTLPLGPEPLWGGIHQRSRAGLERRRVKRERNGTRRAQRCGRGCGRDAHTGLRSPWRRATALSRLWLRCRRANRDARSARPPHARVRAQRRTRPRAPQPADPGVHRAVPALGAECAALAREQLGVAHGREHARERAAH
jgi:hypothetical protein